MNLTATAPVAGALYLCATVHGTNRLCRYGFHRRRNSARWDVPAHAEGPASIIWHGWRDHENGRFLRHDEVVSFVEHVPWPRDGE